MVKHGLRLAALSLVCFLLPACLDAREWVELEKPWSAREIAGSEQVRVERTDGHEVTLERARLDRDERGEYVAGNDRGPAAREVRIPLSEVRAVSVQETDVGKLIVGIAAGLVVGAALVFYLLNG